jgi:hypothetical protein
MLNRQTTEVTQEQVTHARTAHYHSPITVHTGHTV